VYRLQHQKHQIILPTAIRSSNLFAPKSQHGFHDEKLAIRFRPRKDGRRLHLSTTQPIPSVPKNHFLIKVLTAALNPVDYKLPESGVIGSMVIKIPGGPGLDFCGRIVEGASAPFQDGQVGTWSEFVVVAKNECAILPHGVQVDDAAALGTAAMTSWQSMLPDVVKAGARIFVNGGSGGVGTVRIQFAKARGAHVTLTCSTENVELCRSLGADEVWDYKTVDILAKLESGGEQFDGVIDNVWSLSYYGCEKYLKADGRFITVGVDGGVTFKGILADAKKSVLPGFLGGGKRKYTFVRVDSNTKDFSEIGGLFDEGKVKVVIDQAFDFEDVPKAYAKLREGRTRGKLIVQVSKES
jgi:NADPH:quinone reductase-like Zn-dependent oxidoreductase